MRLHTVDVTRARPRDADRRPRAAVRRAPRASGASTTCAPTSLSIRALQPTLTDGDYRVTVAVHGGRDVIAVWPGFHDRAFGVAIDVGSTTIAGHLVEPDRRLGPRERRGDEPADPLRRGPHEPRLVRDDARGWRRGADDGRAQGARRPARHARQQGRHQARRDPRAGDRRQSDHAPPPARHRPDAARARRLSHSRRTRPSARRRPSSGSVPNPGARVYCCRASPATSVRTRRA